MLRRTYSHPAFIAVSLAASALVTVGCGTTRSTDTMRTATEQLLVSDAIDRAVQTVDFRPLARQTVFLDDARLATVVDRDYLVSTLRQHLLATGCILKDKREDADFIVEARAGAVGTDRNDLLFGIPATNVPQILPVQGVPAAIPEVPLAKRRDQRGIAKISMFAYHRETGLPVWQSGLAMKESSSNDVWIFGAGPFQHGTIDHGPLVAQSKAKADEADSRPRSERRIDLTQEAQFVSPTQFAQQFRRLPPVEVAQSVYEKAAPTSDSRVARPKLPAQGVADTRGLGATPFAEPQGVPHDQGPAENSPQQSIAKQSKSDEPQLPTFTLPTGVKVTPSMTAKMFESQLLHNERPKTVELVPSPETDPIALPQPRYDSL